MENWNCVLLISATCEKGFIQIDSSTDCVECPVDYYWVNQTHCERCPNYGQTEGRIGVEDVDGCEGESLFTWK